MIRLPTTAGPLLTLPEAILVGVFAAALLAPGAVAQNASTDIGTLDKPTAEKVFPSKPLYSPYAGRNFPTRPFFGDTHLHTAASFDAGAFGASLTARWPWLVAFCFGLLHGFGFAGALAEVGLPHHAIPVALLFFNLGVEIGQLSFVIAVLTLAWMLKAAVSLRFKPDMVRRSINQFDVAAAYAIGAVAACWLIGRAAALLA